MANDRGESHRAAAATRYAVSPDAARLLMGSASRLADPAADLPTFPFAKRGQLNFCQFSNVLSPDAGELLARLGHLHGDQVVNFVSTPNPFEYMLPDGRTYGVLSFPISEVSTNFADAMLESPGTQIGQLVHTVSNAIVFGSSEEWAIWGSADWEIGILNVWTGETPELSDRFFDVATAVNEFMIPTRRAEYQTDEMRERLFRVLS